MQTGTNSGGCMNDHAQQLRQRFLAGQPQPVAHKSPEQKRAEAIRWLGKRWCLHPASTLTYRRES